MNFDTSQASRSKYELHVEYEQNLILLSLWSRSDNTYSHFLLRTNHMKRQTINGVVAKQNDVSRWQRYLALWRSIPYVELRTGGANTFRDFPLNLGLNRLIFVVESSSFVNLDEWIPSVV